MRFEPFYGANIMKNMILTNDFSDTTKWETFTPTDLSGPKPYQFNGEIIEPLELTPDIVRGFLFNG